MPIVVSRMKLDRNHRLAVHSRINGSKRNGRIAECLAETVAAVVATRDRAEAVRAESGGIRMVDNGANPIDLGRDQPGASSATQIPA
jgi:hypothetical protein